MKKDDQVEVASTGHSQWSVYRRFMPYLRPYRVAIGAVVVIELGSMGLNLVEPWMTKVLFDNGFGRQPLPSWLPRIFRFLASGSALRIVLFAIVGGLLLNLLRHVVEFIIEYTIKSRIRNGINFTFKTDLFNHLQKLSFSYHDRTTVGESLYRVNNDTTFVSDMLYSN